MALVEKDLLRIAGHINIAVHPSNVFKLFWKQSFMPENDRFIKSVHL